MAEKSDELASADVAPVIKNSIPPTEADAMESVMTENASEKLAKYDAMKIAGGPDMLFPVKTRVKNHRNVVCLQP
jgi:hypothetical protein